MELWKTCRAVNNAIRLAMLREIARSPSRGLNVLQAGDFVGLGKAAASQYLKQLSEGSRGSDPSVYVLLYMLDCVAAVACVVMGFEATEDRKAAAREGER